MEKETAGNSESAVPNQSNTLLRELDLLAEQFAILPDQLAQAAGELREPGVPPSESLLAVLAKALRDFVSLRAKVLTLAQAMSLSSPEESETFSSLRDLRRLVQEIRLVEQQIAEGSREPATKGEPFDVDAVMEESMSLSTAPAAPIAADLPSEVEAFLDQLIEEATLARGGPTASPVQLANDSEQAPSIPQKQEILPPEVQEHKMEARYSLDAELPVSEADDSEKRRQESLAMGNQLRGKSDEQEPIVGSLLEIAEQALGQEYPEIADHLGNIALLHHKKGEFAEAETLYRKALQIREQSLGPEHPKVATSLNNLALMYRDQGKIAAAIKLWERSLAIVEKAFGPDHPKAALRLANLADALYAQNEYAQAEKYYQQLLIILEKGTVAMTSVAKVSLKNYWELLRKGNRKAEVAELEGRFSAIRGSKDKKL
ncbi:MAG: tetratricopeptide repeat protein [Acidobacteria bacterium]|nr:tetratricopeptide repeat protein [Acidobacteriota bacterium]